MVANEYMQGVICTQITNTHGWNMPNSNKGAQRDLLTLTLKWLGYFFFQNVISFSDAVHLMCSIFIWN